MEQGIRNRSKIGKAFSRARRENMAVSERILWHALRGGKLSGFRFRRQVPVLDYCLGFYSGEAILCVELDGEQHACRLERDRNRDDELAAAGLLTIRIRSLDLFDNDHPELLGRWLNCIEGECWAGCCQ